MPEITGETLAKLRSYVHHCTVFAEIHTVTLSANGATGRVDCKIEGYERTSDSEVDLATPFERTLALL